MEKTFKICFKKVRFFIKFNRSELLSTTVGTAGHNTGVNWNDSFHENSSGRNVSFLKFLLNILLRSF